MLTFYVPHRTFYSGYLMADLVLYNANVITMDPAFPKAKAIAVKNGIITKVTDNADIVLFEKGKTKGIDCEGRTVIPGLIDAHCHLAGYAEHLISVDLSPQGRVTSLRDVQDRIGAFCTDCPPGAWIRGKGYNEFYLTEKRHPNRHDLDAAAPLHPVKLTHRSGHAHVLNSLALRLVGISMETGDPPGGIIDRDLETGEPTGILYGMGGYLAKKIPPLNDDEMRRGIKRANETLLSLGITSIQDATWHNGMRSWNQLQKWKDEGIFRPAITMMFGVDGFREYRQKGYYHHGEQRGIKAGGVKIIVHEITGDLEPSREKLNEMVLEIHKSGFQAVLHAVEENTVQAACDAIEYALRRFHRPDHRHRIEHCSVCPPLLAKRIGELGIMVVTQPSFIYFSGDRYLETVIPDQLKDLYPVGRLLKNNVRVAAGSDFPIVKPDPFVGVYTAITRMSETGKPVLPEEGVERFEALRMYTQIAAAADFQEQNKGSITVGKAADFVMLSDDPMTVDVDTIRSINVEMTVIDGEIVWRRGPNSRMG